MNYLLDTDICIGFIKKNKAPLAKFKQTKGKFFISSITEAELWFGIWNSGWTKNKAESMEMFLRHFEKLPYGSAETLTYGAIRTELRKKGNMVGDHDLLIASQALYHDMVLVTGNEREFKRVKDLRVENWLKT